MHQNGALVREAPPNPLPPVNAAVQEAGASGRGPRPLVVSGTDRSEAVFHLVAHILGTAMRHQYSIMSVT